MVSVGVDGCRTGWYAVRLDGSGHSAACHRTIDDLLAAQADADTIFIDIPIGLREEHSGNRLCDAAARQALGRRASTVFSAPSRATLLAGSYEAANRVNRELTGRGLSRQSWAICPKILEVDRVMRSSPAARRRVREVHPEVCFRAFAGAPMAHNKKTDAGAAERLDVLRSVFPGTDRVVADLAADRPRGVARDDFLDALCAAVTGTFGDRLATLPPTPETDAHGLAMEMVYADLDGRGDRPVA